MLVLFDLAESYKDIENSYGPDMVSVNRRFIKLTNIQIKYQQRTSHQQSCLGGVINPDWVNILYCHLITS